MSKKEAFAELVKTGRVYSIIDTALDKIAELEQQLAAKEADAARYRWLRNGGNDEIGVGIYDSIIGDFIFTVWDSDLDEAIDKELGK